MISLVVVEAAPEIFTALGTSEAVALNLNGARNSPSNPAAAGSIVVLYATGGGQTSPAGVTGKLRQAPHPQLLLPVSLAVAGKPAEVLFAGETPGFAGLLQINARLPQGLTGAVPVILTMGRRSSRPGVTIWVR